MNGSDVVEACIQANGTKKKTHVEEYIKGNPLILNIKVF